MYIHFSDFIETYESLVSTCIQICLILNLAVLESLAKIAINNVLLKQLGLRYCILWVPNLGVYYVLYII